MKEEKYLPRIIDNRLDKYLKTFGAVCIEGIRGCGKTSTANINGKSSIYIR